MRVSAPFADSVRIESRRPPRCEQTLPKRSDIEAALRRLAPRMPPHEFGAVVAHVPESNALRPVDGSVTTFPFASST